MWKRADSNLPPAMQRSLRNLRLIRTMGRAQNWEMNKLGDNGVGGGGGIVNQMCVVQQETGIITII